MSYFLTSMLRCCHYNDKWQNVVKQIRNWPPCYSALLDVTEPLEAKALYVFTIIRRLTEAVKDLVCKNNNKWESVFIESTTLLFPMLELVGHSRLAHAQSDSNLWAGCHWLRDPHWFPELHINAQDETKQLANRWQIGHLIVLRNYYLHGSKSATNNRTQLPYPVADIMSFELPQTIINLTEHAASVYWNELKSDDGTQGWLERLAQADIFPLVIQGSCLFEEGLVDPDIVVSYLDNLPS